ncbi:MAG: hypothetical protein AB7P21_29250 [Lautropia sp.]
MRAVPLPAHVLLARYAGAGGFVDCHVLEVAARVTQAAFVEAFLTTPLFRLERLVLATFARRPSTDADAARLASDAGNAADAGDGGRFAIWTVEARTPAELLLRDAGGRTRTWLMSEPIGPRGDDGTRLFLGSAVLPSGVDAAGRPRMGAAFRLLLGAHRWYSRALLRAAAARATRRDATGAGSAEDGSADTLAVGPAPPLPREAPSGAQSPRTVAPTPRPITDRASDAAPAHSPRSAHAASPAHPARSTSPPAPRAPRSRAARTDADASPPRVARRPASGKTYRARPTREQIAEMPVFESLPLARITLLETPAQCEAALQALTRARVIGFDTESKPTFTRDAVRDGPHLIQFATRDVAFLMQVGERTPIEFLRAVLETDAIVKAGFGVVSDEGPLEHKLGLRLRGMVEVATVLRPLGHKDALGAKAAVAVVLGRRLQKSKSVQTSNWGAAVLTPRQLHYAANDAYAALRVYEAMAPAPAP